MNKKCRFSAVQPVGGMHIGNYLGAIRQWMRDEGDDAFYMLADLEALILLPSPEELRTRTQDVATILLAAGLHPSHCTLFVQSWVEEHTQLAWMLNCLVETDELLGLDVYKTFGRSARSRGEAVRAGILVYPVVQAADILLYGATDVPAGDEEREAVELTANLARRFNERYGDVLVVPRLVKPKVGARIRDLLDADRPMSKQSGDGAIFLLDPPDVVERKVAGAVTASEQLASVGDQRGLENLSELVRALTEDAASESMPPDLTGSELERVVSDAVNEVLLPLQGRYREIAADPAYVRTVLGEGAAKARDRARTTLEAAQQAAGLYR